MSNVEKNSVTGGFFSSYLPPSEKEMLISGCCLMSRNRAQPLPVAIGWQWGKQSQELRFLFLFCLDCASWNKNWRLIAYMALYLSFMGYIYGLRIELMIHLCKELKKLYCKNWYAPSFFRETSVTFLRQHRHSHDSLIRCHVNWKQVSKSTVCPHPDDVM